MSDPNNRKHWRKLSLCVCVPRHVCIRWSIKHMLMVTKEHPYRNRGNLMFMHKIRQNFELYSCSSRKIFQNNLTLSIYMYVRRSRIATKWYWLTQRHYYTAKQCIDRNRPYRGDHIERQIDLVKDIQVIVELCYETGQYSLWVSSTFVWQYYWTNFIPAWQ